MGGGIHGGFGNTKGSYYKDIEKIKLRSPIKIPSNATFKKQDKEGYQQVKFSWRKDEFNFESRWHTQTPNAPKNTGPTWVVERHRKGIGAGKNARPALKEILVGENTWVSKKDWQAAIRAKRQGTITKEQRKLLNDGHWKDRK